MIKHINLTVLEHVDRRISLSRKAGEKYTESTGQREVIKYTGPWEAILEHGVQAVSGAEGAVAVQVEMERNAGGIGEMTITEETYRIPTATGGDDGDKESNLGTADNPEITSSFTVQAEPLLSHPNFKGITDADAWLLQQVAAGTHPDARIEYNGKKYVLREACKSLSGAAGKVCQLYLKGITQYYEVYGDITVRGTGGEFPGEVGHITTPPGNVSAPSDRDWLCTGKGKTKQGKEVVYTAQYRLSGPGGWNKELYS